MRRTSPLLLAAGAFVVAGGVIHLMDWLNGYRNIPAEVPGSFLVRVGFPVNAALSVLAAVALAALVVRRARWRTPAVLAIVGFQAGSLALLVATREGSVFGWSEPTWMGSPTQLLAVQLAAIALLVAVVAVDRMSPELRPARLRP